MHPGSLSVAKFTDGLSTPPQVSRAWDPFTLLVVEPATQVTAGFPDHVLGLVVAGTCRLRKELRGRSTEGWSGPGAINLVPAEQTATWEGRGHSGTTRAIVLFMPDAFLRRVIETDFEAEPDRVDLITRFLARDPILESVLSRLAIEARNGSPSGRLYAESACEFLARHVLHSHSSLSPPAPPVAGGLAASRLKRVLEYIEENLAAPLTLRALSELAGVSVRHFERAFRQAVGTPAHAYVVRRRVDAARNLLVSQPALSIEQVAARVGFSSSSHLASAFRRQTGYSPRRFRQLDSMDH